MKQLRKDDRVHHFFAAGITPVAIHPKTRERVYLLATEKHGKDVGKACDYGGYRKYGETPECTAAREFIEETRGIFWPLRDRQSLLYALRDRGIKSVVNCRKRYEHNYVHFLLSIQYEDIACIQARYDAREPVTSAYNEKVEFIWVTEHELFQSVLNNGRVNKNLQLRSSYLYSITHFPRFAQFIRDATYDSIAPDLADCIRQKIYHAETPLATCQPTTRHSDCPTASEMVS